MPPNHPAHAGSSLAAGAMLLAGLLSASAADAKESDELIGLINAYRAAPQRCEGKPAQPAGPLAADPALSRVRLAAGSQLQDALANAGYQAARAEALTVSGPSSAAAAMEFISQRYCGVLLSQRYAAIGVARDGNNWRIVLAQPLLSPQLGDWRQAGRQVLELVNAARAKPRTCGDQRFAAAPAVAWNEQLANAALAHSRDMANRNYFRHEGKNGSQVNERAEQAGYRWRRIGENIGAGQGAPKEIVSGWLSSPGHCANIMNPHFTEMGAAYALSAHSDGKIYWTQVFGTPR